jgi:SHS2 domain-containing protein
MVHAWGRGCAATARQALLGVAGLVTAGAQVNLAVERQAQVAAPDLVAGLVGAANELLYLLDTEGLVPGDITVACGDGLWQLTIRGDLLSEGSYQVAVVPKAATYHQAHLGPDPDPGACEAGGARWTACLILDL